jgi:Ca2+-binding RTX toxin-like protein
MTAITTNGYTGVAGRNEYFLTPGAAVPNNINALDGHDVIDAYNAPDFLIGGLGRDLIIANDGGDTIYGDQFWNDETTNVNALLAAEADAILGRDGADTIFAGGGNNFVNGGAHDDYIMGGSGHELLQGGAGNDSVYGAAGNDTLVGGTSGDGAAFLSSNIGNFTTNFNGINDTAQTVNWVPSAFLQPTLRSPAPAMIISTEGLATTGFMAATATTP